MMNDIHIISTKMNESKEADNGYKIIEVNISDPAESLFSVVTPIKNQ